MVGLLHIAATALVAAGALKIRNPDPTIGALTRVGLAVGRIAVVVLAAGEITIGLGALIVGGPVPAAAVGMLYAGFAGFIAIALKRGGETARCGCFGQSNAPPSMLHVVLNFTVAVAAWSLMATSAPSIVDVVIDQPAFSVPYLTFVTTGAAAFYLIIDRLPRVHAAARGIAGGMR